MRDKLGETLKKRLWDEHSSQTEQVEAVVEAPAPALAPKLTQWLGAAVSLALVCGVIYWVFQLGQRDANEVPVIQAMAGEARELPVNSGGPEVDNQGLQVNEVLGNNDTAPVEPETTLAPPPQRVVAQDVTPQPEAETGEDPVEPTAEASDSFTLPPSIPGADPNMVRPERRVSSAALSPTADLLSDAIASAILEATNEDAAPQPVVSTPSPVSAQPAEIAVGEIMIQLGAYDDEGSANSDFDALLIDNQDLLGGLTRFVERREAGGRVFYRLRARGFTNMEEASNMCTALLARSIQCIAVTAR